MKSLKYYILILMSALLVVGCSDDNEQMNTGKATVGMKKAEMTVKETAGVFNVPVTVSGEQNGPIRITIEVSEYGENPAMDDVHYMVTTKSIIIPSDKQEVNIEIKAVDDDEINNNRTFVTKIAKAEGASIDEANDATIITIKDNDANFYEKFAGKWKFYYNNTSIDVNLITYDESDPLYEKEFVVTGLQGYSWTTLVLTYAYDIESKKGSINIPFGTLLVSGVDFGLGSPDNDVYIAGGTSSGLTMKGEIPGEWSSDFKKITFDTSAASLAGAIFDGANFTGYVWFSKWTNIYMVKQ